MKTIHIAEMIADGGRDGTVEACLSGPRQAVEALVAWSRHGPPGARVTSVTRLDAGDGEITGSGFHIAATRQA